MKKQLENQGIQFEFTIHYTLQQNSVAERMNLTIIEMAGVGKIFRMDAKQTAVYLINRSPTEQ